MDTSTKAKCERNPREHLTTCLFAGLSIIVPPDADRATIREMVRDFMRRTARLMEGRSLRDNACMLALRDQVALCCKLMDIDTTIDPSMELVRLKPKTARAKNRCREHGDVMILLARKSHGGGKVLVQSQDKTWSLNGAKCFWLGWFSSDEVDVESV